MRLAAAARLRQASDIVDSARLRFVVLTMLLDLALSAVSSVLALGWKSAAAIVVLLCGLYVAWTVHHRDGVMLRLLVLGFAAGLVELLADWYAVIDTQTLFYPTHEPKIGQSPAYMPLAWTVVLVQLGCIGWWIATRSNLALGSLATAVLGGVNIPIYEALARGAGWWRYEGVPTLFHAPWYIIGAEALIALVLPAAVGYALSRPIAWSIGVGAAVGLWMLVATVVAYRVLG
jgi:hypothetical protein